MSDFDKEAEREKLRKKFEKDREKRKSTQVMSELLLKGATMTNKHCDACGNPIFRQNGEEFCPICRESGAEAARERTASGASAEGADADAAEPADSTEAEANQAVASEPEPADAPGKREGESADASRGPGPSASEAHARVDGRSSGAEVPARPASATSASRSAEPRGSDDLSEARAALIGALTRYAREAEAADDPRRAKELLSAAREAAETLAALRR
ncbi:Sjogren's syndrome/scleroderma autoantigen 1 family protein [Halegenticoccus soli]|uniref:Sjogren's syndrome/scleroderma autoantigen 1 family protein n=1 Tax=Halegenticoccus soli TaxID=1985678 RepID=UPI000C6C93C9|nr:Sjogren's syndrome/scleroderma autoantigen 1 family protein [Halegenticoccus soli]